ncbi:MAG: choice-of-anchor I family protein [Cyanobacteria bacterium SID2]|nr:choice-of-anchor I family protein [Cyanobacteria bacterium SID2]MBP0003570.1 choice-of-anchor I family protein [Cyanobacteria bacterium SBC]
MAIELNPIGTFRTGIIDESAAEIVAHDPTTQRLFVVNANNASIDVLDISTPTNPTKLFEIDATTLGAGANSVAVSNGIVAVAIENQDTQAPGLVAFYDVNGTLLNSVTVGALPDMVTFTPDGTRVLVANEGEPNDEYTIDPEGSVSIIDITAGVQNATVLTADFQGFNSRAEELRAKGVRIFGPNATVAQDLEPEYIAVSPSGGKAFVSLQENNAFAAIDIASATVEDILPLGFKDHSRGNPTLQQFNFPTLPPLGTTPGGQQILLGGLSGLWYTGTSAEGNLQFVAVPDRGPNGEPTDVDGDGANERPFVLPDYQARVVNFELNPTTGSINLTGEIPLFRQDGTTPITGLPNIPGVDEEPVDLLGNLLEYDPLGADLEGVLIAPDGTFWMVDEYRPAIWHFQADGTLIDRFIPQGTTELAGENAGPFGTETLPAEYSNRRRNRGFEAIALDSDSGILYAFIQTPIANPDRAASDSSQVIRILGIDPTSGNPVAEYVYLLEDSDFRSGGRVDKIGDAVYAGNGKFFAIERDAATDPTAKKFIYEFDLTGATNLLAAGAPQVPEGQTLEQLTTDELIGLGIQPVNKTKVTNLPSIGYLAGDKPEGLTLLPDGRLAVLNDNDFGLIDAPIPVDGTVPLNPNPVPVVLGLIDLGSNNDFDASDEDGSINIQNQPTLGIFQPDGIASFTMGEQTFYIGANEGDARDYDGFSEEERVEDLTLDPTAFPNAAELQAAENLGRLKTTNTLGDLDGDGDFDRIYSYGARSFSIWDEFGNVVYDSGDEFERLTAQLAPQAFNSQGDIDSFDNRSDDKGPEPEGIDVGVIDGRTYAFIGLERIGGIMVYDVTNPTAPSFVQYANTNNFSGNTNNDIGPEGIKFISATESPNGKPLLAVGNEVSGSTTLFEINPEGATPPPTQSNKWQILHTSDLEGSVGAIQDAPNFAAVVEGLEIDAANQGINSIVLSAGDNYIPGPFFSAAGDRSVRDTLQQVYSDFFGVELDNIREGSGRFDITNMNVIGFDASAVGNHEFDAGTSAFEDIVATDIRGDSLGDVRWLGAQFPYLSTNLDFSNSNLGGVATNEILPNTAFQSNPNDLDAAADAPKFAPATIIERNGDRIGVVGATTPLVPSISSTGDVSVIGSQSNDMAALAGILQPTIDSLLTQGINKIVTVSHLQQFQLEQELIPLLRGVDVAIAGGSDTIVANSSDRLRPGDEVGVSPYPFLTTNADGDPTAIVSTDGEYSYVGRLVVEFDDNGVLIPSSIAPNQSGAFATDDLGVTEVWNQVAPGRDPFATGTKGGTVRTLTNALQEVVNANDRDVFGETTVFIEGRRENVRTEETTLGNLTADANLSVAQQFDSTVQVSIKNGGGLRAPIGEVVGDSGELVPPQANPLSGKQTGQISQLDIENTLRFNNELTLLTLTAEQLTEVIEHGVSATAPGATPGQFPQVGGVSFSFDPTLPEGERVKSLAIVNDDGDVVDPVVVGGEVFGDPNRPIRIVTLNFLAGGGDSYPFPEFVEANASFANVVDLPDVLTDAGAATAADPGSEQDALAEFLLAGSTFTTAETAPSEDTRIQILTERSDEVFDSLTGLSVRELVNLLENSGSTDIFRQLVVLINEAEGSENAPSRRRRRRTTFDSIASVASAASIETSADLNDDRVLSDGFTDDASPFEVVTNDVSLI